MIEAVHAARHFGDSCELPVRLGADVSFRCDFDGILRLGLCLHSGNGENTREDENGCEG